MDDTYSLLWLAWIALFGVIEGAAIINKQKGDTLSEHVWWLFSVSDKSNWYLARRTALGGFLAWLVAHFMGWV